MSDNFKVVAGYDFFDLVPDSGQGPDVSFSGMIGSIDFDSRIERHNKDGWELVSIGWFHNVGCELLFKRINK